MSRGLGKYSVTRPDLLPGLPPPAPPASAWASFFFLLLGAALQIDMLPSSESALPPVWLLVVGLVPDTLWGGGPVGLTFRNRIIKQRCVPKAETPAGGTFWPHLRREGPQKQLLLALGFHFECLSTSAQSTASIIF